jgi:hypothetical protein
MAKKKAEKKIKVPKNKKDKSNKNPHITNENHDEEVVGVILKLIEKFGEDSIVITHFIDGTAVSVADKAKKKDKDGNEALVRAQWKREDDYVWVGVREAVGTGTVV